MRKMVEFQLHENLAKKTKIIDLPLSVVLLEDEKNYPWLFLVPRRPNITKIMDLSSEDQILLLREMDAAQRIIQETFHPTQINVAAIGNKTAQLHVHVIGRFSNDPAWPKTVWDHPVRTPYSTEEKKHMVDTLQKQFLGKL